MVWCCYCKSKPFLKSFSQYGIEAPTSILGNAWLERDKREEFPSSLPSSFLNLCSLQNQVPWIYCLWPSGQKRLFLLCSRLPLQPEHPCFLTSSTMRQQPQIAWLDLLNGSLWGGGSAPAAQEGGDFIAHVWLPCYPCLSCHVTVCKPGGRFSCFLTLLLCRGIGDATSPPLSLGALPPKLTRQLQFFCSLVGNLIWPFQVGQEQILDLLTMKCFYLNSTKEVQWKDCSCWAKAPHLLQSSYAFTSGTSVKALLTLADECSFHRKLVNLSVSSACFTYLWENVVFDSLAKSCNDRNVISR